MTILCYHSVKPGWESALAVEPADLDRHCAWLSRRRTVLPLGETVGRLDDTGRMPPGTAALTFDDGFADLYDHALPVLRRYRLPATVFLVAQTLTPGGQQVDWVDDPGPEPLSTLTADQVLEMQADGVDFQSHSFAHHDLTRLSFEECVQDLADSRDILCDLLGRRIDLLAYPRGRHDRSVRDAARRAGYTHAFALPEQLEEPGRYAVPRVGIYRGNSTTVVRLKASRPYLRVRSEPRLRPVQDRLRRLAASARRIR